MGGCNLGPFSGRSEKKFLSSWKYALYSQALVAVGTSAMWWLGIQPGKYLSVPVLKYTEGIMYHSVEVTRKLFSLEF